MKTEKVFDVKFLSIFFTLVLASVNSFAGPKDGGGGGAYVIRDAQKRVVRATLVDLYEADHRGFHVIYDPQNSVDKQFNQALNRLSLIHPSLAAQIAETWQNMPVQWEGPDVKIKKPTDVNATIEPVEGELEGMMYYDGTEQMLHVNTEIFNHLVDRDSRPSPTAQASARIHEALYKILRDDYNATDSRRARFINGCLFTNDVEGCLKVYKLDPSRDLPKDREIWTCTTPEQTEFDLVLDKRTYPVPGQPEGSWTALVKRFQGQDLIALVGTQFKVRVVDTQKEEKLRLILVNRSSPLYMFGDTGFLYDDLTLDYSGYPQSIAVKNQARISCQKVQSEAFRVIQPVAPRLNGIYTNDSSTTCDARYLGYDSAKGLISFVWINDPKKHYPFEGIINGSGNSGEKLPCQEKGQKIYFRCWPEAKTDLHQQNISCLGVDPKTDRSNGYELSMDDDSVAASGNSKPLIEYFFLHAPKSWLDKKDDDSILYSHFTPPKPQ